MIFEELIANGANPAGLLYKGGKYVYDAVTKGYTIEENDVSDWLYGEWSKDKYDLYQFLNATPAGKYFNYLLDVRADKEYMRRYGLDWKDLHDPRKLRQTSSGSAIYGAGLNFVSDNIKKLYS